MEAAIVLLRGVHLAAVLSVLGCAVTHTLVAPAALRQAERVAREQALWHQTMLLLASLVVAMLAAAAWLVVQSASMADAASIGDAIDTVPLVVSDTVFGHTLTVRVVLLLLCSAVWRLRWLALAFAIASAAAEAWLGHAGASGTLVLSVSVGLHVVSAGAWLGGLIPLLLLIRDLPRQGARIATMQFSALGWSYVLAIAATALVQARVLVGSLPALIGTGYGQVALLKTGLFLVLIGIAALNRFRLARVVASRPRPLLRSIAIETGIALAVVFAAARLSEMMPAAYEQQMLLLAPLVDPAPTPPTRLAAADALLARPAPYHH